MRSPLIEPHRRRGIETAPHRRGDRMAGVTGNTHGFCLNNLVGLGEPLAPVLLHGVDLSVGSLPL